MRRAGGASEAKPKATLLVIEDDLGIRESLELGLAFEDYRVLSAGTGSDGLRLLAANEVDAVILDILLPGSDGYSVLREIRSSPTAQSDVPVLMLTALDEVEDRVRGLKRGADDYIVKPFALAELLARLEAVLRRKGGGAAKLAYDDVRLDTERMQAWRGGAALTLSPKEFMLLQTFIENAQRLLTKEVLMRTVWGEEVDPNTLEVHISSLRKALGDPPLIRTVRGYGYILDASG